MERDTVWMAFGWGWADRVQYGLLREEQLYRKPWWCRAAWRIGWELANLLCELTGRPLRTSRPSGGNSFNNMPRPVPTDEEIRGFVRELKAAPPYANTQGKKPFEPHERHRRLNRLLAIIAGAFLALVFIALEWMGR